MKESINNCGVVCTVWVDIEGGHLCVHTCVYCCEPHAATMTLCIPPAGPLCMYMHVHVLHV